MKSWVRVADLPDLTEPGGFVTAQIGRVPLVVVGGQDVRRVQRGLRASNLPPGVHSETLECRIGHFERMLMRELRRGLEGELVSIRRAG